MFLVSFGGRGIIGPHQTMSILAIERRMKPPDNALNIKKILAVLVALHKPNLKARRAFK